MDLSMVDFDGSEWRGLKMGKTEDYSSVSSNKQMLRSNSNVSDGQQMLSFSVNESKTGGFGLYNNYTSNGYSSNTGYGPFTASQWMELEHQALIYKYILANVSVPSNLLFPIKKALHSTGLSAFSIASLRPTTLGWGAYHMGFANNTDPEPGRCRRTDGKKWRCARDAVLDQKYCERHINRGRHRSRKPVEGQNGHSVNATTSSKLVQVAPASIAPSSATVVPGGGGSGGLGLSNQTQLKSSQPGAPSPSDSLFSMSRNFVNKDTGKDQAVTDLSMFSSGINLKNNQYSIEPQPNPYKKPTESEFGLVFSDSLLNPVKPPSDSLKAGENSFQGSVHQFMDEWPKTQLPDNTQLSISIPISATGFMSSTSSPTEEKLAPSRLSSSDYQINEHNNRRSNWVPISWETAMGGPLGEVLHNTNQTSSNDSKLSSGLNLMTEGWNSTSSGLASSPNGPFQRMAFGSHSNSSAGSSPRGVAASLAPLL